MENEQERSLVMIKPDQIQLSEIILDELDPLGRRIADATVENVPRRTIEEHYAPHKGKEFYLPMIEFFTGNKVVIAVYEWQNIVQVLMDAIGVTEPAKAGKDTIRGKYGGNESYELAESEGRQFINNVIHRSDSPEEAEREIRVWSEFLYQS